jgi:hypothetical protein
MQAASVLSNCLRERLRLQGVESMGWKSQGEPARCDIFLTFATINSFPMRKG